MASVTYGNAACSADEYDVVMQFARILRLQARMLEQDGDLRSAHALRRRAARSVREVRGR